MLVPLARMPVRMRSGSFYPARRFLRDSCVRYHRVQHSLNAATVEGRDAGRKNAMRKRMKGERGEGRGARVEGGGRREEKRMRREPNQSSSGHEPPTTFTRHRNYEVVQLGNQLAIFRGSTSTAARIV